MTRTIGNGFAVLAAAGVLCFSPAAASRGADDCPALPDESGFEWRYKPGPDFYLCYAKPTNGGESSFGMYFGFAPGLFPSGTAPAHSGKIGEVPVTWTSMKTDDARSPLGFQTLLREPGPKDHMGAEMTGGGAQVHVWILAASTEQLKKIETLLGGMKIEPAF